MLYQFLLYNEVKQLYVYIYIYTPFLLDLPPTSPSSHSSRSSQCTELSSLCLKQGATCLFYTWQCIYVSATRSVCLPLPSPTPRLNVHSLHLCIFLPCRQAHLYYFSRFHIYIYIYVLIYDMFFLFLFTSLHMTDSRYICCLTI